MRLKLTCGTMSFTGPCWRRAQPEKTAADTTSRPTSASFQERPNLISTVSSSFEAGAHTKAYADRKTRGVYRLRRKAVNERLLGRRCYSPRARPTFRKLRHGRQRPRPRLDPGGAQPREQGPPGAARARGV